jgi:glycosyltransferase involved in cell wall biosynthesis
MTEKEIQKMHHELWEEQKHILGESDENLGIFITDEQLFQRRKMLFDLREEYLGNEKPINKIIPLVSVCIPTYQHKNYIEECLNGALMQKTNFTYEIIVCDDGSTDGTTEICRSYAEKHLDKIRLYDHNRAMTRLFDSNGNAKAGFNWWWTMESARGKYIALCEGDDYWTDPLKLQKQVDFLEVNQEYSLCCHRYRIYDEEKQTWCEGYGSSLFKRDIDGIEVDNKLNHTRCWLPQTLTVVYRKNTIDLSLLARYKYSRDFHLFYHILKSGKGYCMNYDAGVYRRHLGGIHSMVDPMKKITTNYNICNELYLYNPDDEIIIFSAIKGHRSMICGRLLFNKECSIALVKDIIFLIKMEFHYNGLQRMLSTLSRVIICLIVSLFTNNTISSFIYRMQFRLKHGR